MLVLTALLQITASVVDTALKTCRPDQNLTILHADGDVAVSAAVERFHQDSALCQQLARDGEVALERFRLTPEQVSALVEKKVAR